MAFAARPAVLAEENAQAGSLREEKAGAGKLSLLAQGSKRRAPLGDIGNMVPAPVASRNAKDADAKFARAKSAAATLPPAPATLRANSVPTLAPGRPITRSQAKAACQHPPAGMSMSGLLQSRSEAAVEHKKPVATAAMVLSPMPDIDSLDLDNPLAAADYVNDVFSYFRRAEPRYRVAPDYMRTQADINEKMRAILVDWLVEVHLKFKLMPESLFLSVNLIDRFLAIKAVTRKNLQLVGVAGMLIASKYEEIWAPEVRDFVYIADKAYSREQILGMEKLMCNALGFQFTVPTPFNFLSRFLKAAGAGNDKAVCLLASYLIELTLPDYAMLSNTYSLQAAAAVHVALRVNDCQDTYPRALRRHSGYSLLELAPCVAQLVQLFRAAPTNTLIAVYKKYSSPKLDAVATGVWDDEVIAELQSVATRA